MARSPRQTPRESELVTQHNPPAPAPSDEQVAQRAYEKWVGRGQPSGDDLRDWFEAQQELCDEAIPEPNAQRT